MTRTRITIAFEHSDAANKIIKDAGYAWDADAKFFAKTMAPEARTKELALLLTARMKIDPILRTAQTAQRLTEAAVKDLRLAIPNLQITARSAIYVALPKDERARTALAALGGRPVHTNSVDPKTDGQKTLSYYRFKTPPDLDPLRAALTRVSTLVPPPRSGERRELAGGLGIGMAEDGGTLIVTAALLPRTLDILAPAQPKQLADGTFAIRMDIIGGAGVRGALDALQAYHQTLLVPPYKPGTGVDLTEREINGIMDTKADSLLFAGGRAEVDRVTKMLTDHFGSLDTIALTPGADPVAIARLVTVAAHLQSLDQTIERVMARPAHSWTVSR